MNDDGQPLPSLEAPSPVRETADAVVPLMDPRRVYGEWGAQAEARILEILRSHVYVKGPHVGALEEEFAELAGVRRAIAVDSCTDALTLVLRAVLARRPARAREVILPAFTFVATAGAVVNAGGRPVFADVEAETMNLDPAAVARLRSRATAAVLPVHLFGSPADMEGIREAVGGHDVFVLEDAAQAVGATLGDRAVGSLGHAGTFSFYPSKNLAAAGDGGMVTTDDAALADVVTSLRDHGQTVRLYDYARVGTNSRMDEIQAAVLRVKLPRLEAWTRMRQEIAARYEEGLASTPVRPQRVLPDATSARHLYTVRIEGREAVQTALERRGIQTGIYYPRPLHRTTGFSRYAAASCPVADRLSREVLSLPCFPGLGTEEQERVIGALRAAFPA